ncbi:MAG: GDYXXLXY domain-containing protein [Candidatus Hydrogenedentota bacterium]
MRKLFIAAVCVQILILALVPYKKIRARFFGRDIVLVAEQYDPYDPFLGYYVRMSYEIGQRGTDKAFVPGRVYTVLETDADGVTHPASVVKDRGDIPSNRQFITGFSRGGTIEYGLEQYFVPEERHAEIDDALRRAREDSVPIRARVRVDEAGNSALIGITIGHVDY